MTLCTGLQGRPSPSSVPTINTQFCRAEAIDAKACESGASRGHSGSAARGFMAASTVRSPTKSATRCAGGSSFSRPQTSGTMPSAFSVLAQRPASQSTRTMSRADSTPCKLPPASWTTRWCWALSVPFCRRICLAASLMVAPASTVRAGSMHQGSLARTSRSQATTLHSRGAPPTKAVNRSFSVSNPSAMPTPSTAKAAVRSV
mmetsp:Transcript_17302/g.52100  ORF Transcript_17302/g.52100 Transcript_17302/m.52100 type:complete len:203 (+) Transcript_17302:199-807(+)